MKRKVNILLMIIIMVLVIVILFIDDSSLSSLYYNYDDTFVIKEVNTGKREDVITYNEVSTEVVSDTTNNTVVPVSLNNNINKWVWPTVEGNVVTSYYSGYHKALDISAGYGSSIYAAGNGVVASVHGGCVAGNLGCNGRGGNYIVIKPNNYYTVYMHLLSINVSPGQTVSSGQFIGTMGNTGNVIPVPSRSNPYAGTHLHFSLYVGEPYREGYAINPMNLY